MENKKSCLKSPTSYRKFTHILPPYVGSCLKDDNIYINTHDYIYIHIYIYTYIYYDIIKLSLMIIIILHHVKSIPKGPPGGHCRSSRWRMLSTWESAFAKSSWSKFRSFVGTSWGFFGQKWLDFTHKKRWKTLKNHRKPWKKHGTNYGKTMKHGGFCRENP